MWELVFHVSGTCYKYKFFFLMKFYVSVTKNVWSVNNTFEINNTFCLPMYNFKMWKNVMQTAPMYRTASNWLKKKKKYMYINMPHDSIQTICSWNMVTRKHVENLHCLQQFMRCACTAHKQIIGEKNTHVNSKLCSEFENKYVGNINRNAICRYWCKFLSQNDYEGVHIL